VNEIYPVHILDHGLNPRNLGVLDPADAEAEADNPLCGDHLHLTLRLDEHNRIAAVGWDGENCTVSLASASMLGEEIIGKTLDEVRVISKQDIFEMLGIPLSKNRVKCALLSLKVLTIALYGSEEWQQHEVDND
jgi:nitrogen fixation NifU-like protein